MPLWDGRFSQSPAEQVLKLSESISYDRRLYPYDIKGSLAHAKMLARQGIIPKEDARKIASGLKQVKKELDSGKFVFKTELEDIHMNIEARLTELIGPAGARLHTGRSRNDQIATDERLYLRQQDDEVCEAIRGLQYALWKLAADNEKVILPGFTHLQHAQPVLFAHHLLAYMEMLSRDMERLADCRHRINRLPLGAGALAGSTLPLDREFVAKELGFEAVLQNSMDAVADRDVSIEFLSALAIVAMHLSRLAEDIAIWFSQEFSFVEIGDAFTTGSSLMPQKKNPDIAELTRGKTGRVYGALLGLMTTLKGLPLTYNRDLQEDKEGLFDAIDTIKLVLSTVSAMLATVKPKAERMLEAASDPALMATDLAEALVRQGVPFREAHHQVGCFVGACAKKGITLAQADLAFMQKSIPTATPGFLKIFNPIHSVAARDIIGGTAPSQVHAQLCKWAKQFGATMPSATKKSKK
ncbi:MAG: argininosuccinate lyase [Victivallales bacterium]|nr:argininosuccinate lyase [Victivallales bacterium]